MNSSEWNAFLNNHFIENILFIRHVGLVNFRQVSRKETFFCCLFGLFLVGVWICFQLFARCVGGDRNLFTTFWMQNVRHQTVQLTVVLSVSTWFQSSGFIFPAIINYTIRPIILVASLRTSLSDAGVSFSPERLNSSYNAFKSVLFCWRESFPTERATDTQRALKTTLGDKERQQPTESRCGSNSNTSFFVANKNSFFSLYEG